MEVAKLPTVYRSEDSGACIQDFETTLQPYVTPSQLLGVLNFSALWNPVTYVYDTAIGDSPHIIESFLARPNSPKHKLYAAVRDLIKAGAVKVLIRKVVQVRGTTLFDNPNISQIYEGWQVRDRKDTSNFTCQRFGEPRCAYNRVMDRLLDESYGAIKPYDPDIAKPEFRRLIRHRLDTQDDFRSLVFGLPMESADLFQRACVNNPMMTTVDLWRIVSPLANSSPAARRLTIELGYINQQAIARSVAAGISGSDTGHGYRPVKTLAKTTDQLKAEDFLEQADLALDAPALELLGRLDPSDIVALRRIADKSIFQLSANSTETSSEIRSRTVALMQEYWREVCSYVDTRLPSEAKRKVKIYAYVDQNIPTFKHWYKRSGVFRDAVEISAKLPLKLDPTGTASGLQSLIQRAAVAILYTKSDEFRKLEGLRSSLWAPQAAWSNQDD